MSKDKVEKKILKVQDEVYKDANGFWNAGVSVSKNAIDIWNNMPEPMYDDEEVELIKQWQATGDEKIFNKVFYGTMRLAASAVYRIEKKLVNKVCDAYPSYEDLLQEAGLVLMKAIENFDPNQGKDFSTFLYTYIRTFSNKFYRDYVQRKSVAPGLVDSIDVPTKNKNGRDIGDFSEIISDNLGIVDRIHEKFVLDEIYEKILSLLKEKDRKIFISYHIDKKTQQEIADEVGIHQTAVSRTVNRLTENIRRICEDGISAVDERFFDHEALKKYKESLGKEKLQETDEIGNFIQNYGGIKNFSRDFLPRLSKVAEIMMFKSFYEKQKSLSDFSTENGVSIFEAGELKHDVDEKIQNFMKEKQGSKEFDPNGEGKK